MLYKIVLGLGVLANVGAQMVLKSAVGGQDMLSGGTGMLQRMLGMFGRPFFWLSVALYGLGFLFYTVALSKLELSKAYPVSSAAAIVLIVALSISIFKESLDVPKTVGLILCVAGIFLVLR